MHKTLLWQLFAIRMSFWTGQDTSRLESSLNIWDTIQVISSMGGKPDARVKGKLSAHVHTHTQTLCLHNGHPLPFSCLTWEAVVADRWPRAVSKGPPSLPATLPCTRKKKISKQRRKASAAKWLIGFYGNWLRSTPAAYPTVPLSPYF